MTSANTDEACEAGGDSQTQTQTQPAPLPVQPQPQLFPFGSGQDYDDTIPSIYSVEEQQMLLQAYHHSNHGGPAPAPAPVVGSAFVHGPAPGLEFGSAAPGAFSAGLPDATPFSAPTVPGLYAPLPGPFSPGLASSASPALSVGFGGAPFYPAGTVPYPHPGFGPGITPSFAPDGPPAFLPPALVPALPGSYPQGYSQGYGYGYDQPPLLLPPFGPPFALANNHGNGSGNGFGHNFSFGYRHPPPNPQPTQQPQPEPSHSEHTIHSPPRPATPSGDRCRRRRVRFTDYNKVIRLPASPEGSVDAVLEVVPQGPPGVVGSGSDWQELDCWAAAAAGSSGFGFAPGYSGVILGAGPGSPSRLGFESLPPFVSSGFDSHQTVDTELPPLPDPYNYFSVGPAAPAFPPFPVIPDIFGGPAFSVLAGPAFSAFAGTDFSGPAFSAAATAATVAQANALQQFSDGPAFSVLAGPAFSAAAPAAPAATQAAQANPQQQQHQRCSPCFNGSSHHPIPSSFSAPPLLWDFLSTVPVQDLVDDLRQSGVVDREAEAWQLRRPVGERNWDLSAGDGEEEAMGLRLGLGVYGEVEELELGEVPVVVQDLVKEINEFDG